MEIQRTIATRIGILLLVTVALSSAGLAVAANPPDWQDFFNTGGELFYAPEVAGTSTDWGEWSIGCVRAVDVGFADFAVTDLAFPCASSSGIPVAWVAWIRGEPGPPPGGPETAMYSGIFVPPLTHGTVPLPFTYVDFDIDGWIPVFIGNYLAFGCQNPGYLGLTDANGTETWSWRDGAWQPDSALGRTSVLQVMGFAGIIPVDQSSWSRIKSLY